MANEYIAPAITLAGGLYLFALGQVVSKLLDPCIEFKKMLSKIGSDLELYHEYKAASPAEFKEASAAFRKHAVGIEQGFNSILMYEYVGDLLSLPTERELGEACRLLLDLSEGYLAAPKSHNELGKLVFVNVGYRHDQIRKLLRYRRIIPPRYKSDLRD